MLQSNLLLANSIAGNIRKAATDISNGGDVSKDSITTIQGNTKAATSIDQDASVAQQVAEATNTFVDLISSTAAEFESLDKLLADGISNKKKGPFDDFLYH